jgi:hypothetical protein
MEETVHNIGVTIAALGALVGVLVVGVLVLNSRVCRLREAAAWRDVHAQDDGKRLDAVEQWERWIVKLQKRIKALGKCNGQTVAHVNRRMRDYERVAANMAECMKRLTPLVNALNLARQPAEPEGAQTYKRSRSLRGAPNWSDLISQSVPGSTCTGVTGTPYRIPPYTGTL